MAHTKEWATIVVSLLGTTAPVRATFHLMQIEQVIGGVGGDTTAQAIQLRLRSAIQNQVQQARLRVWDARGQNPILLIDIGQSVPNSAAGSRILIASANFASLTGPTPNFILTNLIPPSYLDAGSLTFESDFGPVYWRLSWGGPGYTGLTTGQLDNDANGNFGPPYSGPLPFATTQALRFTGTFSAFSTTNAADYALTAEFPAFTNNANQTGNVPAVVFGDFDRDGDVDLTEAVIFAGCLGGPGVLELPVGCAPRPFRGGDLFPDGVVDLLDAALFQSAFASVGP